MKKAHAGGGRKRQGKTPAAKPYWEMTAAELHEATKEFDQEFIGESFGPLTPEQHAQFERARKRGRPRQGLGAKTISVTVEMRLLAETDQLAKKLRVPRALLVARGLHAVLAESRDAAAAARETPATRKGARVARKTG